MSKPTETAYSEMQQAYDFFNDRLFNGGLPPCLITMQRGHRTLGYFSPDRWKHLKGNVTDEIAMNPDHFRSRSLEGVLSTLAHEMVHLWHQHNGKPSRVGYHNKEWATQMEGIGLIPSNTGAPGGKRTGQQMDHYVEKGGAFEIACAELIADGFIISWADRLGEISALVKKTGEKDDDGSEDGQPTAKAGKRWKYTCPDCELNAWAKPEVAFICGACDTEMQPNL